MKNLAAILALGLALTHTATAEVPATFIKLVGLSTVPEARCAFLLVLEANRPTFGEVWIAEGKTSGALELVAIDDQAMTAKIRNGGKESVLSFTAEAPVPPPARAIPSDAGKKTGAIKFQNLPLSQLLSFYSELTGRTILRSTMLPVGVIAAHSQNLDREGIVRFLERTLTRAHLQSLPQGDKFTVLLPENYALPAAALWENRKATGGGQRSQAAYPAGAINFKNVELVQVLQFYGQLAGRKVERAPNLPNFPITIKPATSLSVAEALYAFDTVLLLNGIQIVAVDDQTVKAVPTTTPVNKPAPPAKSKPSLSK